MAYPSITKEQAQQAVDALEQHNGVVAHAARSLGLSEGTFRNRLTRARTLFGLSLLPPAAKIPPGEMDVVSELQHRLRTAETQLAAYKNEELTTKYVRSKIMGLAEETPTPPKWVVENKLAKKSPGVPTLLCSDWHWGEVIAPNQVGGVNEYNLDIAHQRARRLIERTVDLLNNHMVNPKYPGIVFALGGDMLSGDIHDELRETNDIPLIPAVVDLYGVLIWCIETLAEKFERVFVPAVTGNHGRNTKKIQAKNRAHTSFDWLVYILLEKYFLKDKRVSFLIPEGADAYYRVFNHRYLLTHGDQFRGGDGMIGALGPIIRGDHKKRSRNNQVGMGYDTMLLGHWHQLIQMNRLVVNGSLCGYNEYAYQGNFPFEEPKQGLWITHPEHGITFSIPVHVGEGKQFEKSDWVST